MPTTSPLPDLSPLDEARARLEVALPDRSRGLEQDEEWFLYKDDGRWVELRIHDYDRLFGVQGLYERLVYDILDCRSPDVVGDLLADAILAANADASELRVLDLGAGNGCVAESLLRRGLRTFVGADIEPNAATAAERDRPGLYQAYAVGDFTALEPDEAAKVDEPFDVLTCVAALGFGDIPVPVFRAALAKIRAGGFVAFTIKNDFLDPTSDDSGFSKYIRGLIDDKALAGVTTKVYQHRVSSSGEPIEYTAVVARKG